MTPVSMSPNSHVTRLHRDAWDLYNVLRSMSYRCTVPGIPDERSRPGLREPDLCLVFNISPFDDESKVSQVVVSPLTDGTTSYEVHASGTIFANSPFEAARKIDAWLKREPEWLDVLRG